MVLSLSLVLLLLLSLSPPCNSLSPAPPTWLGGPDWGEVHYFYTRQFGLPDPGWGPLRVGGSWSSGHHRASGTGAAGSHSRARNWDGAVPGVYPVTFLFLMCRSM